MGTPFNSLTKSVDDLSLHNQITDFIIKCGEDIYKCNKAALASRSPYFQIACYTNKAMKYSYLSLPEPKKDLVRAMMRFLQSGSYTGPVDVARKCALPCEMNSRQPAGKENGMSMEFRSVDNAILKHFPKLRYGYILHGDVAIKAGKIITYHELFNGNNEGFQRVAIGEYRCQPELLSLPIQISLFIFLSHLSTRHIGIPNDPVFHADMYNQIAVKYMFEDLKPQIAKAFYLGTQSWINTGLIKDKSFITAAKIILQPLLRPRFGDKETVKESGSWDMADKLVQIMAENWGWMRHDEDVIQWLDEHLYRSVRRCVELEVGIMEAQWRGVFGNVPPRGR